MATLHEDMVGARQTAGSRVQHIIRSPHHQASYLADVVQSVAEMVISGNSGYLAALQVGSPYPYSRPIFSRLGTRDGYRAEIVPNFNNSDHMVFNDGIIGIPAVGFINWPDDFIHSSDDDLWQIDPTQLKRNAFIIAASALYLANAGPADVPTLLADVLGRGSARQGKDLRVAMQHVTAAEAADRADAFRRGTYIIEAGAMREERALNSIMDFVQGMSGRAHMIEHAAEQVQRTAADNLTSLAGFYGGLTGDAAPDLEMTAAERAASGRVPVNIDDVDRYLSNRPRPGTGLHGLMTFSVWGHVDGESSYLDIYKQVMAEAAVHGSWYYGTVTLDQVVRTLDAGVRAGIIVLR
jgi:hypothetical protein